MLHESQRIEITIDLESLKSHKILQESKASNETRCSSDPAEEWLAVRLSINAQLVIEDIENWGQWRLL